MEVATLRRTREMTGLSLAELARLAGTADSLLREVEAQRKPLSYPMACRLAEVLDCNGVDLYARHALDQWREDLDLLDGDVQTSLTKLRRGLVVMAELQAFEDLPDHIRLEMYGLAQRTADALSIIGKAVSTAPVKRRR